MSMNEHEGPEDIRMNSDAEFRRMYRDFSGPGRRTIKVDVDIDFRFWALLPAINVNLHTKSFEFEFLFIGIYIARL